MNERMPVVLVHGYMASKILMVPMQQQLRAAGLDAHLIDLPFMNFPDIRESTAVMQSNLERMLDGMGATRCDLVGLSLGGHMTLYYIKYMGGAERVRRMVAVGTPFGGTWASLAAVATMGWFSPAARQTLPGSSFVRELAAGPLPESVRYYSVFATGDPIAPPRRCRLPGARNLELRSLPLPVTHQGLGIAPSVVGQVAELLLEP